MSTPGEHRKEIVFSPFGTQPNQKEGRDSNGGHPHGWDHAIKNDLVPLRAGHVLQGRQHAATVERQSLCRANQAELTNVAFTQSRPPAHKTKGKAERSVPA